MGRDDLTTKEIGRLAEIYASRLTRDITYKVKDMPELKTYREWSKNTQSYRDGITWYVRDRALKLLSDAGFPPDVLQKIRQGNV